MQECVHSKQEAVVWEFHQSRNANLCVIKQDQSRDGSDWTTHNIKFTLYQTCMTVLTIDSGATKMTNVITWKRGNHWRQSLRNGAYACSPNFPITEKLAIMTLLIWSTGIATSCGILGSCHESASLVASEFSESMRANWEPDSEPMFRLIALWWNGKKRIAHAGLLSTRSEGFVWASFSLYVHKYEEEGNALSPGIAKLCWDLVDTAVVVAGFLCPAYHLEELGRFP